MLTPGQDVEINHPGDSNHERAGRVARRLPIPHPGGVEWYEVDFSGEGGGEYPEPQLTALPPRKPLRVYFP